MNVINLTYTFNTRDLGGMKTVDGKVIRFFDEEMETYVYYTLIDDEDAGANDDNHTNDNAIKLYEITGEAYKTYTGTWNIYNADVPAKIVVYDKGDGTYIGMAYLNISGTGYEHMLTVDVEYTNEEKTQFKIIDATFNVGENDTVTQQ